MTPEEALKVLKLEGGLEISGNPRRIAKFMEGLCIAQEALEGRTPKKLKPTKEQTGDRPVCGATVRGIEKPFGDYCSKCGQKLNWSEN